MAESECVFRTADATTTDGWREQMERLLTTAQAAKALGLRPQTLRKWRHLGRGPRYVRLGGRTGRAMYAPEALEEWVSSNTYTGTMEESAHE